jgi:hypothetical protein
MRLQHSAFTESGCEDEVTCIKDTTCGKSNIPDPDSFDHSPLKKDESNGDMGMWMKSVWEKD